MPYFMRIGSTVVPDRLENHILVTAHHAREHYFNRDLSGLAESDLILGVFRFLEGKPVTSSPEWRLLLTDKKTVELPEFERCLPRLENREALGEKAFSGNREFSSEKLEAMTACIASRGYSISASKLETLLYYSDLVHYILYGHSISGSKYIRHRVRPAMERFNDRLADLVAGGIVRACESEGTIAATDATMIGRLSMLEIVSVHWVLSKLGEMSEKEVLKYAESENAHRFTRRGGYIAYEYGRLLKNLPASLA